MTRTQVHCSNLECRIFVDLKVAPVSFRGQVGLRERLVAAAVQMVLSGGGRAVALQMAWCIQNPVDKDDFKFQRISFSEPARGKPLRSLKR